MKKLNKRKNWKKRKKHIINKPNTLKQNIKIVAIPWDVTSCGLEVHEGTVTGLTSIPFICFPWMI